MPSPALHVLLPQLKRRISRATERQDGSYRSPPSNTLEGRCELYRCETLRSRDSALRSPTPASLDRATESRPWLGERLQWLERARGCHECALQTNCWFGTFHHFPDPRCRAAIRSRATSGSTCSWWERIPD